MLQHSSRSGLQILLPEEQDTLQLGQNLAGIIISTGQLPLVLLLQGELGAGKTTLVRGLIQGLPGGDQARVSSPSFNIVNIYPTNPEVLHLDLYRLSGTEAGDSLWEHLVEQEARIIVVEWSEHLPAREYPEQYALLSLTRQEQGRTAHIQAFGSGLQDMTAKNNFCRCILQLDSQNFYVKGA